MSYDQVQMFTRADMEEYAANEVKRTVASEASIQKYAYKRERLSRFKNSDYIWSRVIAVVALAVVLTTGYNLADDEPISNEYVADQNCIVMKDYTYDFHPNASGVGDTNRFCATDPTKENEDD